MRAAILAELRIRRQRDQRFGADLFRDPAWNMMLDLARHRIDRKRCAVTSACIASGVPPTTALRWIEMLIDRGLVVREPDENDARRAWLSLTDEAFDGVLASLGAQPEAKAA